MGITTTYECDWCGAKAEGEDGAKEWRRVIIDPVDLDEPLLCLECRTMLDEHVRKARMAAMVERMAASV